MYENIKFPIAFRGVRIKRSMRYFDIAQALDMSSAQVCAICLGKEPVPDQFIQQLYAHQLITASDAAELLRTVSGERQHMTKLEDITPEEYRCDISVSCPAIYRTPDGKLVIIGKRYTNDILSNRIGIDESAITVPMDMIKRALSND